MKQITITWKAARVNQGLTQKAVCNELGITAPTLINWEHGNTEPSFSMAKKLSELYSVPLELISDGYRQK